MLGEALGSEPEPVSGIPPKVNTENRAEEPLSLTIVSIYLGMTVGGFFTPYALSHLLFSAHCSFSILQLSKWGFRALQLCEPSSSAASTETFRGPTENKLHCFSCCSMTELFSKLYGLCCALRMFWWTSKGNICILKFFFLFHDTWEFGGQNAAVFFQLWAVAHISFLVNPYFLSTKMMRVLQYTLACWSSYQTSGNTALPASVCRFRWLIILSDIAGWLMLRLVSLWSGPHSICTTVNKCCLSLAWKLQSPAWLLFTSPQAHLSIKHTKSCPLGVRLRCNMQELAN